MNWQVLPEIPADAPGAVCYGCGSALRNRNAGTADHERCIDTGQWIDFEGRLVFCESCVTQWAHALGWVPATTADVLRQRIFSLESQLLTEEGRRRNAEVAFQAVLKQAQG